MLSDDASMHSMDSNYPLRAERIDWFPETYEWISEVKLHQDDCKRLEELLTKSRQRTLTQEENWELEALNGAESDLSYVRNAAGKVLAAIG